MMLRTQRTTYQLLLIALFFTSLLSACQNGNALNQVMGCNQSSVPVVKRLTSSNQASLSTVYAINGSDLLALNAGNGALRWCDKIAPASNNDEFSSVARNRDALYTTTYDQQMMAFQAQSGALLWGNNLATPDASYLPPTIAGNTVYGGIFGMYALNTRDGSVRWQYLLPPHTGVKTTPVVMNRMIYFETSGQSNQIIALNLITGKELWVLPLKYKGIGELVAGDGMIIFTEKNFLQNVSLLDVVNAQNGQLVWQRSLLPDLAIPIEANGLLYIAGSISTNGKPFEGSLYAFDVHTGAIKWSAPTSQIRVDPSLLLKNILYGVNGSGSIVALNALNGHLLWQTQLQVPVINGDPTRLSLLNNELFVGIESSISRHASFVLHAFNLRTRQEDWYANITGAEASPGSVISVGV